MHAVLPRLISALGCFAVAAAITMGPTEAQSVAKEGSEEAAQAAAAAGPCRHMAHERATYIVCEIDLKRHVVRTYWKRPSDGKPYGTLWSLVRAMKADGKRPVLAMNAGMFKEDRSPVGLYVEDGKELVGAQTADGTGNFYMKPNGIFYVAGNRAGVVETTRFLKEKPKADFATQSGPMLVIDGKLHPKISPRGVSRYVRNGVCVRGDHTVLFAISRRRVSFGELAHLFKDKLACPNALYLDGQVSGIYTTVTLPKRFIVPIGPMFGAYARAK